MGLLRGEKLSSDLTIQVLTTTEVSNPTNTLRTSANQNVFVILNLDTYNISRDARVKDNPVVAAVFCSLSSIYGSADLKTEAVMTIPNSLPVILDVRREKMSSTFRIYQFSSEKNEERSLACNI